MDSRERRQVENDDSLLSSVAGVPLTRLARIGLCLVWAGFWCARVLLTDALVYLVPLRLKSALAELLGNGAFDQGFSICMIWLSVEVVVIIWEFVKMGVSMLIAKTTPSLIEQIAERLPQERLEALVEKKRKKALQDKEAKENGKKG